MRAFNWLGTVVLGVVALGCQSVSVRPLETPAGPAVEVPVDAPIAKPPIAVPAAKPISRLNTMLTEVRG